MAETLMIDWDGVQRPATVFKWSKTTNSLGIVVVALLGALGAITVVQGDGPFDVVLGMFLLVISLGAAIGLIGAIRGTRYIALFSEGILQREPMGATFVPWDTIERIGRYTVRGMTALGIRTTTPARTEGAVVRAMYMVNRPTRAVSGGFDVGYPILFIEDRAELEALIRRCAADRTARSELGKKRSTR